MMLPLEAGGSLPVNHRVEQGGHTRVGKRPVGFGLTIPWAPLHRFEQIDGMGLHVSARPTAVPLQISVGLEDAVETLLTQECANRLDRPIFSQDVNVAAAVTAQPDWIQARRPSQKHC